MRGRRGLACAAAIATAIACDDGVKADRGLDAKLQVTGAQFYRGAFPSPAGGPNVRSFTASTKARAGQTGHKCGGEADPATTGVAIGLAGDVGYWVIPAGVPDVNAQSVPTFNAEIAFAASLPTATRELVAAASDIAGHFGVATTRPVAITGKGPPEGALVFSLSWDDAADLDLHVVDPSGSEVFNRNVNSYEPPGPGAPPEAPNTPHDGGVLDFDSNAQCVQDGLQQEDVVWTTPPPAGRYLVRVATSSLCGEAAARWRVQALLQGTVIGTASGEATENDTRYPNERGGGLLVLQVDVP